jgi:dTDP-4-amino-4,6-dideoxygalactose transaminase
MMLLPHEPYWSKAVYHLYVVQVADRDELQKQLAAVGIGTGIHYPIPLHLQKAYQSLGYKSGAFPVAEAAATKILSLPMYPTLGPEQQRRVVEQLVNAVAQAPAGQLAQAVGVK